MEKEKIEAIKNISSEVNGFHPILRVLFNKLPNISSVEYSQGPNEMGADFILTKNDSTLGDVEYIGVIVKIGQIKQDHSEIDRQIEECELERKIEGGLRKIFLSEIWVVSNENITNGAKDKIHHKYKNKNIKFLSGEKITHLIETYYPEYWKNISVEVGEYFSKVRQYCNDAVINKSLFDSTSKDIYIEQDLVLFDRSKDYEKANFKKHKKVNVFSILEKENYILVEATMGIGKSTLLAQISKKYSENENFKKNKIIPIIITAKNLLSEFDSNVSLLIERTTRENRLTEFDGTIILIDGIDEIDAGSKEIIAMLNNIYQTSKNQKNTKIIISSRNIEDPEIEASLDRSYVRYRLCQLTVRQVISLVGKICNSEEIQKKLEKDLDKSHLFKVLPKTPISAILLAKLLNENVQEIPSTMTELYGKYMELVLGRWDINKGLQSQTEYDVKNNVTINIANFIMEHSLDEISEGDFRSIYDDYVKSRNIPNIDKEALFGQLKKNKEIFSTSPTRGTIRFRHRTFAEFFMAQGINRDNKAHIDESIFSLYWNTTYFFYLGIKRDSEPLINAINEVITSEEINRMLKIFSIGNFLLAAHLTPYDSIKSTLVRSIADAAEFYDQITNKNLQSALSGLSKVHVLCLFTRTLCDSFGYDFFVPALSSIAEDIYTTPNPTDIQLLKMFFINSILVALSNEKSYDYMIDNYGKQIPLPLQIGIRCHTDEHKANSIVIKKFVKKFDKSIKSNEGFKNSVLSMMRPPKKRPQLTQ
jgi:hypothetical protein